MKQILRNKFVKSYKFRSREEMAYFLSNQKTKRSLVLQDTHDDNYFSYIFCDSLMQENLFSLSFCSDKNEDELNLLVWNESKLIVLDTGREIHLIDNDLNIIESLSITTPLIGLHLTSTNNLLILEEASIRLVDFEGKVLLSVLFDLIEEFNLTEDVLSIRTAEESKIFNLKEHL